MYLKSKSNIDLTDFIFLLGSSGIGGSHAHELISNKTSLHGVRRALLDNRWRLSKAEVSVIADPEANRLIVRGDLSRMSAIQQLVEVLDVAVKKTHRSKTRGPRYR